MGCKCHCPLGQLPRSSCLPCCSADALQVRPLVRRAALQHAFCPPEPGPRSSHQRHSLAGAAAPTLSPRLLPCLCRLTLSLTLLDSRKPCSALLTLCLYFVGSRAAAARVMCLTDNRLEREAAGCAGCAANTSSFRHDAILHGRCMTSTGSVVSARQQGINLGAAQYVFRVQPPPCRCKCGCGVACRQAPLHRC